MNETELLRLAAEYGIYLLYKHQHDMGDCGGSAEFCNLHALMQAGLGCYDGLQVPLDEIVKHVKAELH